jgi:phage shock protein B
MIGQLMAVLILATIFGGIALIVGVTFMGVKMIRGLSGKGTPQQRDDETRCIQEIYQGLNKMEERIEALETILLERQKSDAWKKEMEHE